MHRGRSLSRRRMLHFCAAAGPATALTTAPAGSQTLGMKCGHNLPLDSPLHVRLTQLWARVAKETAGKLNVRVYPNNVLGGDTYMLGQLRSGALEFEVISGQFLSAVVPVSSIEAIPFAFKTARQAQAAADGALGAYVRSEVGTKGIHMFSPAFEVGFYQITNSVRPIRTVDDFAGLRIRTGASKLSVDTFRSLGAAATPMNLPEVYTALQTHQVDGQYNPYSTIELAKFFEVQKYLSELNLAYGNYWLTANQTVWDSLGSEIRSVVERNVPKYVGLQRRDTELFSVASADKLVRQGMIRNIADQTTFRAKLASGGFYERWRGEYGAHAWSLLEQYSGTLA